MQATIPTITRMLEAESQPPAQILFFDGVCGLCNKSVDFILRRDLLARIRFAPLQGDTAARNLPDPADRDLSTLVFVDPQGTWKRSAAVVRILHLLHQPWPIVGTLIWLIPSPLRDLGYRIIATSRYRVFGQTAACRMPTQQERSRFLP